jgi:hypothetical protein
MDYYKIIWINICEIIIVKPGVYFQLFNYTNEKSNLSHHTSHRPASAPSFSFLIV